MVGSAAYMLHWLKDASRFVQRHRAVLQRRPVWLFSSGPLGTERVDDRGYDGLRGARPKEFAQLPASVHPRGTQISFGAWDPQAPAVGLVERLLRRISANDAISAGDFRDWDAIEAWARDIARQLHEVGTKGLNWPRTATNRSGRAYCTVG